jgi:predicted metal-dependent hydrolase
MQAPATGISRPRIPIVPRRMKFDFGELLERKDAHPDNHVLTALLATLSGVFPPGEKEFIQSVRLFMADIHDPELLRQVELFSTQEGHHALQHRHLNMIFEQLGYGADKVAALVEKEIISFVQQRSRDERLASTVVLEHFTASMAHFTLTRPEHFDVLPAALRELLFWHAIEEIEHKAVAFDVYQSCVGNRRLLIRTMLLEMVMFPWVVSQLQRQMLRDRGTRPTWRELVDTGKFLLGPRGLLPSLLPQYLSMLKPGFHPWDIDDHELVDIWARRLSSVVN